ncbi:MAG: beta-galactosidase, partial [Selenomonadaceae bacterium]|nr:beta-galactosidase [Selenomonadaceae bacterium]
GDLLDYSMLFTIPKNYSRIKFYGLGPFDNYNDRCEGARLGIFETNIFDNVEKYLLPQEMANHCGVRWFKVVDNRGRGLKFFAADKNFEAQALPYSPHEIENARHQNELPPHKYTFVRIALENTGAGGDDSWQAPTLDEYKVFNTDKHFEFYVKAI